MRKYKLLALNTIILTILLFYPMLNLASSPTFTITKCQPSKPAYYIGETVDLQFTLEWKDLGQNYTLNIELWNSTTKLSTLETKEIDGTNNPNGSYTTTYTLNDLTKEFQSKKSHEGN